MSEQDPLEHFRSLDPTAGQPDWSVKHPEAASAMFEEITMTSPALTRKDKLNRLASPSSSRSERPARWYAFPAVALAAVVLIAGAGLFSIGAFFEPSAASALMVAAQNTAEVESGRVQTEILYANMGDQPEMEGASLVIDYHFEGDDSLLEVDFPSPAGIESQSNELVIDGITYLSTEEGKWVDTSVNTPQFETDLSGDLGFETNNLNPSGLVDLIELADDFEKVSDQGDATSYSGTIAAVDLVKIADRLPAGLKFIVNDEEAADFLPDQLGLRVTIENDTVREIVVDIDGKIQGLNEMNVSATMTITYSELGEPQNLQAPDESSIVTSSNLDFEPEREDTNESDTEMMAAFAVLNEVEQRQPGLCEDENAEFLAKLRESSAGDATAGVELDQWASCLAEAGETEAANAIRLLFAS